MSLKDKKQQILDAISTTDAAQACGMAQAYKLLCDAELVEKQTEESDK